MSPSATPRSSKRINPGLRDKLAALGAAAGIDVEPIFANAEEFAERTGTVVNIDGLVVTWVNKAIREAQSQQRLRAERHAREQERYADIHVELYRLVATHRLSPRAIAATLERLRASGHTELNPKTIENLYRLGDTWPEPQAGR